MPVSLDFDTAHHHTGAGDGIDVHLASAKQSVELLAKLDTGAAHCIFDVINHLKSSFSEPQPEWNDIIRAAGAVIRPIIHRDWLKV